MNATALLLTLAALAQGNLDPAASGVVASAPMPAGGLAVYGMAGLPELRAGFRQGFHGYELGAEAGLDYLLTKLYGAAAVRSTLATQGPWAFGWELKLGAFGDAGARYHDATNLSGAGLRMELGASAVVDTSWPLSAMLSVRVPVEVPLTVEGQSRVVGLLGGGVEVAVSEEHYVSFAGGFGPDIRWGNGSSHGGLAVEVMVGFGYRLF